MTSSATPTDDKDAAATANAPEAPDAPADAAPDDAPDDDAEAPAPAAAAPASDRAPWWWRHLARIVAGVVLLVGWGFIGWHEHFRVTPPAVFLCLGWLAVVEAVLYLWHTGFSAADESEADQQWWRPVGEKDELEREKKSLLKAIKEIEFDREMGKMTDDDAGEIVRMYRARAIEVIKAIDALDAGADGEGTIQDEIERELRARIALSGKGKRDRQKNQKAAKAAKKGTVSEDAS